MIVMIMQMTLRAAAAEKREKKPLAKQIEEDVLQDDTELSLPEVNALLNTLWQKREAMEKQEGQIRMQLLLQFLHHARQGSYNAHASNPTGIVRIPESHRAFPGCLATADRLSCAYL